MASKSEIRKTILAQRRTLAQRPELSRQMTDRLPTFPEWMQAREILLYVDLHSEVITRPLIEQQFQTRGHTIVPYCDQGSLTLNRIKNWDELVPGMFGVLEPTQEIRKDPARNITPAEIDLVIVPGVAFDSDGGRLGYGQGYYDRLFSQTPETTLRIALAFECQLVERIPREDHDVLMHFIVTESRVLRCQPVS